MLTALGCLAFGLFFLSDCNDWLWGHSMGKNLFPAGALILVGTTVTACLRNPAPTGGIIRLFIAVLAIMFTILLVYTLFFALPAKASYASPGEDRPVCGSGVYALCRHPGVLWFAGLYLCLWGSTGFPLRDALVYTALNVLLVLFEDRLVFPARLSGYAAYRETTPFLLPNLRSIRACLKAD